VALNKEMKSSIEIKKVISDACGIAPKLLHVDQELVLKKIFDGLPSTCDEKTLSNLIANTAGSFSTHHYEYNTLSGRVLMMRLHLTTPATFSEYVKVADGFLSKEVCDIVFENAVLLDKAIDKSADFQFDGIGLRTLMKSYLVKINGVIVETPQYLYMRVSLGIHGSDLKAALKSYLLLSKRVFGHATPTMFNAGTKFPQLASCFLLDMQSDSITGIYKTLADCARISKYAGGIGVSISKIRSRGSLIKGTNGTSNGIVPMCKVFNETAQYCDQGGGKRKGGFAMYISPFHPDILRFLDLKKNNGVESERARDLFYALWISDLFMKRVLADGDWSLICPNDEPRLCETYGDEFECIYKEAEAKGLAKKTIKAKALWHKILESTIETGTPYLLFKDACNAKSNQKNIGYIKSSNLCSEIVQFTSPEETAVCNLASVALPRFIRKDGVDFDYLREVVHVAVDNLNKVINRSFYPVPEAKYSNFRHRPIGLGVSGFHDCLFKLGYPWDSPQAAKLNRDIFECIYYSALEKSCALAKLHGPYETFKGSPASEGKLQFDLWKEGAIEQSGRYDWTALKEDIQLHGLRNSLLTALMPTASSSQILGVCEGIDPLTSNVYVRRLMSGEFIVVNKYLQNDLIKRGLWTRDMRKLLTAARGSVQNLPIPDKLKNIYKTSFEVKMKASINLSAERGRYICQSQSLNLFFRDVTHQKLHSAHVYSWKSGLKTAQYYLRTSSSVNAISSSVTNETRSQLDSLSVKNSDEDCLMCSA
jgi:ribonucleoside-diphosphate reductase alpha subunit